MSGRVGTGDTGLASDREGPPSVYLWILFRYLANFY